MRKIFLPVTFLGLAIIVVLSCRKTQNNVSSSISVTSLNQLFSALRSTPQSLNVIAGRDTIVFGASGTMLHFYSNSFKDAGGSTITSGIVNLQLVEMYNSGDMICNRATTLANGNLLTSGGQVHITATMNGQGVYVNTYGVGFIHTNKPLPGVMTLFYGNTNNGDSVANWNVSDTTKRGNVAELFDTAAAIHSPISISYGRTWVGYVFDSASSLEYTNCDAFYFSDSPKVSVSVIMPDNTFTASNTQVYLVLPDINCAMSTVEPQLGSASYDAATNTIKLVSESQTNIVPEGMKYELIVVANKNSQYYFYKQSGIIPQNGLAITATMNTDTQADIKSQLSTL